MCGIAGVFLRDPNLDIDLDRLLDFQLDEIDHRGGDATGFAAFGDDGVLEWQKAACDAKDFTAYRRPVPKGTRVLIAHTRMATQGLPAFMENNHPLRRGAFFVIHNGHVNNDTQLFKKCGKQRYGQVDSESIAARLSTLGSLNAVPEVMEEIDGAAAIAAVDERMGDRLTLARGFYSPMWVLETDKIVLFGSTQASVLDAYRRCIGTVSENRVYCLAEGTAIHYIGRERREVTFKAYDPPVTTTTTQGAMQSMKRISQLSRGWDWDDDQDYLDCDDCGTYVPWNTVEFHEVHGGYTVAICRDCREWDRQQAELDAALAGADDDEAPDASDQFSFVNQAVLDTALATHGREEDWLNEDV